MYFQDFSWKLKKYINYTNATWYLVQHHTKLNNVFQQAETSESLPLQTSYFSLILWINLAHL